MKTTASAPFKTPLREEQLKQLSRYAVTNETTRIPSRRLSRQDPPPRQVRITQSCQVVLANHNRLHNRAMVAYPRLLPIATVFEDISAAGASNPRRITTNNLPSLERNHPHHRPPSVVIHHAFHSFCWFIIISVGRKRVFSITASERSA